MDERSVEMSAKNVGAGSKSGANQNCSEISIKEFLDFLKTAYQIQDSLSGILQAGGMTEAVDWVRLKENEIVKSREAELEEKHTRDDKKEVIRRKSDPAVGDSCDHVKRKLSEVLSEGLLDSVLPYLVPSSTQNSRRSSTSKISSVTDRNASQPNATVSCSAKKKSEGAVAAAAKSSIVKNESEVEIHVCDEVKNMKKDFICNQKLLVEKMGYFAEVTTGQRLEDMDISVHCDIGIFEWLMRWVKKDNLPEDEWPQLDPQCVIPVLVSAAFLQMEPLQNDCLLYCHEHMNEILRTSTNLSCINDSILTRLAAMYTNAEVEAIRDRKDKIQSKIFTKLIHSLGEPEPESVRGHWSSLARVYRCGKCQQLVAPNVAQKIPCVAPCMQLQCDGSIISQHIRDPTWNINDYILKLHKTLKTWRKVYWRLWGDCHFLYCSTCRRYFPARQIGWCRHHPDPPQYFTLDAQKAPLPVGRYPCCGERAYRFQLLPDYSGCQFREHTVCTKDVRDSAVVALLETNRHLIEEEPPQLMFPERLTRLVARDPSAGDKKLACKETFWWEGFQIIPPRPKLGLLSSFTNAHKSPSVQDVTRVVSSPPPPPPPPPPVAAPAPQESNTTTTATSDDEEDGSSEETSSEGDSTSDAESSTSSSSTTEVSAESNPAPVVLQKRPVRKRKVKKRGHLWQHNLSARSNQDIQRAHEEKLIKEMTNILNMRTSTANANEDNMHRQTGRRFSRNVTPVGGLWVRLESEWRDVNCPGNQNKARSIFTGKGRLNRGGKL